MSAREAEEEALLNFVFSEIFLQWTYHLLSRHMLTPTVRYYGDRYTRSENGKLAQTRIRARFKWHGQFLAPDARRLIRDFKAIWKVT